MDCPANIVDDISFSRRIASFLANCLSILVLVGLCFLIRSVFVIKLGISWSKVCIGGGVGSVVITAALYVFYVYIVGASSTASASSNSAAAASKSRLLKGIIHE